MILSNLIEITLSAYKFVEIRFDGSSEVSHGSFVQLQRQAGWLQESVSERYEKVSWRICIFHWSVPSFIIVIWFLFVWTCDSFSVAGYKVDCIKYDVSAQAVSIHVPVTRLLAGLTAQLSRWNIPIGLAELHHRVSWPLKSNSGNTKLRKQRIKVADLSSMKAIRIST